MFTIFLSINFVSAVATPSKEAHGKDLNVTTGAYTGASGAKIFAKETGVNITHMVQHASSLCTNAFILDSSMGILNSSTFTGLIAEINYPLTINTVYYVACNATGAIAHQRTITSIFGGTNITGTKIDWIYGLSGGADGDEIDDILYINISSSVVTYEIGVQLNSPTNDVELPYPKEVVFNITTNSTVYNITNATLYIWNSTGIYTNLSNLTYMGSGGDYIYTFPSIAIGAYDWNVYACGNQTGGTENCYWRATNSSFNETYVVVNSETYNATAQETSSQTFKINITYDNSEYVGIDGNLIYNGTSYAGTSSGTGSNKVFSATVNTPEVSVEMNVPFYWSFELTDGVTISYDNSTTHNQTVSPIQAISITNNTCPTGYFESINYTWKDTNNLTYMNVSVEYNFDYGISQTDTKEIYGQLNNIDVLRVCVNETYSNYLLGYGELDYQGSNYVERRYYMFDGHALSNSTTESYTLYDLLSSSSTSFLFTIRDSSLTAYEGKYITLNRWYPDLNAYKVVEMGKTDNKGQNVMKVEVEDVDYRVAIYHTNGTLIYMADAIRMACTTSPCSYILTVPSSTLDAWDNFLDLTYSLVYSSGIFTFTFSDASQDTSNIKLEVYRDTGESNLLICNNTASDFAGVLTCDVSAWNGNLRAVAYRTASPETSIETLLVNTATSVFQGTMGLFIAAIVGIALILMGVVSPILTVFLAVLALVPAMMLGALPLQILILVGAMGGIVIHFMKKSE